MIRRILFWKYGPAVSDKNNLVETLRFRFQELKAACPGLLEVQVEPTLPGSTHDIALLCTFSDRPALDAYQFNPRHLSLRAEIAYQLRDRVCADVELPG